MPSRLLTEPSSWGCRLATGCLTSNDGTERHYLTGVPSGMLRRVDDEAQGGRRQPLPPHLSRHEELIRRQTAEIVEGCRDPLSETGEQSCSDRSVLVGGLLGGQRPQLVGAKRLAA